jgi:hypothetical protein
VVVVVVCVVVVVVGQTQLRALYHCMVQVVAHVSSKYIGVGAAAGHSCSRVRKPRFVNMAHSSIGNMTNTLIETGARHMQQCRTNYDVLVVMAGSEEKLLQNDDKWCMAKDELVVSCGKNLLANATISGTKHAYPSVVTTLGDMTLEEQTFIAAYHYFAGTLAPGDKTVEDDAFIGSKATDKAAQYRQFQPVGFSVGRACAHAYKGDTIASVQIGGLRTVLNGAFEVQTGDLIQMYIPDAEQYMFNKTGGRKEFKTTAAIAAAVKGKKGLETDKTTQQRRAFYNRGQGIASTGGADRVKQGMFSIKPYMESHNDKLQQYYGDRVRIFARALSSARPFEPVDIMIARQSM